MAQCAVGPTALRGPSLGRENGGVKGKRLRKAKRTLAICFHKIRGFGGVLAGFISNFLRIRELSVPIEVKTNNLSRVSPVENLPWPQSLDKHPKNRKSQSEGQG